MDNLGYLFTAFAVVWVGIFGYILLLSHKQRQLQREIERLEEKMRE